MPDVSCCTQNVSTSTFLRGRLEKPKGWHMLELFFIFVVLPKRITKLARERNRSAFKWSLAAIGAWIGAEVLAGAMIGAIMFTTSTVWGIPEDPEKVLGVAYLPALLAALISAELVVRRLRSKP